MVILVPVATHGAAAASQKCFTAIAKAMREGTMRILLALALLVAVGSICEMEAQSPSTKIIRIEVDGKEIKKNYKVSFLASGKWLQAERTATGFVVPDELTTEEYLNVFITFGNYKLHFPEIHISNFKTNWIIGVDLKPFSEELVNPEDARKTKQAYYIQFEGGGLGRQLVITVKKT